MIDQALITRLYGVKDGPWLPYRVFGKPDPNGGSPSILHVPGKHGVRQGWVGAMKYPMHGYRGLLVQDYGTPVDQQPVKLCWAGIDIDFEDNAGNLETVKLPALVSDLLFNQALIRTSKSGRGVHCIFILHTPMLTDYATATAYAKRIVAEPIKVLEAAGITKCVSGLPNLWLWSQGGLQRTVSDTGACVSIPTDALNVCGYAIPKNLELSRLIPGERFTGVAAKALAAITAGRSFAEKPMYSTRYNVNIGDVKRRLEGLVDLKTKSKCRPEHAHEVNGFLELTDDGTLTLVSNADDNQVILRLTSF